MRDNRVILTISHLNGFAQVEIIYFYIYSQPSLLYISYSLLKFSHNARPRNFDVVVNLLLRYYHISRFIKNTS